MPHLLVKINCFIDSPFLLACTIKKISPFFAFEETTARRGVSYSKLHFTIAINVNTMAEMALVGEHCDFLPESAYSPYNSFWNIRN